MFENIINRYIDTTLDVTIDKFTDALSPLEREMFFNYSLELGINGDADVFFLLGELFEMGIGVEKNMKESILWFEKYAGYADNPDIDYYLGECYYMGTGVSQSIVKALDWFKSASRKGDPCAAVQAAHLYNINLSDYRMATQYFLIAYHLYDEHEDKLSCKSLLESLLKKNNIKQISEWIQSFDKSLICHCCATILVNTILT